MAFEIKDLKVEEFLPLLVSTMTRAEHSLLESLQDNNYNAGNPYLWALGICAFIYLYSILLTRYRGVKAPLVGFRSVWEPPIVAKFRFFRDGKSLINAGYKLKQSMFKFVTANTDMVVLSNRYIDELRSLPTSILSPTEAHAHNLLGSYTGANVILQSDLHFRLLQAKLTPNLHAIAPLMQDELDFAMKTDFPRCRGEWVPLEPYHVILSVVARISARVFMGFPLCRNDEWLEISTQFTENLFVTVTLMRLFPSWLHPLLATLLPARWKITGPWGYTSATKKLIVPEIEKRRKEQSMKGANKSENLLQWMMDCAVGDEGEPGRLAHLQLLISLASIHTTQMAVVHVLYDLAARPEYIESLREEIQTVLRDDGGWNKNTFHKLRKLDSFMSESQRLNPPSILAFHRVVNQPLTLSDGVHLPKGTHFCMAAQAIRNDEDATPSPAVFDGFRSYNKRLKQEESHRHQFATTAATKIDFGHGKYSCPGRFFASLEIKSILVRILQNYDFRLPDGQGRPANLSAHEYIFPNPAGKLLFKERDLGDH